MTEIQKRLFALQDAGYREGSIKLNPSVDPDSIIGIRIPALRALAKELRGTAQAYHLQVIMIKMQSIILRWKPAVNTRKEAERLLPI